MVIPTMTQLLEAGVHFGHQVKRWNPKMDPFIFGARNGVHVIDLAKTVEQLSAACEFVKEQAAKGATILFVGTKRQAVEIIEEEAKRCQAFWINRRWIGGFLTNFDNVYKNIEKLNSLMAKREEGEFGALTKKEQLLIDRQIARLQYLYGGVAGIKSLPDIVYIVDCKREQNAVAEARRKGVKTVAICDTNTNPDLIDYPIPGNDDAIKAIKIITAAVADAYLEGRSIFEKEQVGEGVTEAKKKKTETKDEGVKDGKKKKTKTKTETKDNEGQD